MASGDFNHTYIGDVPYGYGTYWPTYYQPVPPKQGWQCPVCGQVYNPDIPYCWQQHSLGQQIGAKWFEVNTTSVTAPDETTQVNDTA